MTAEPLVTENLPEDAIARREVLELRTTPDEERPKLPPEMETMVAAAEERSAQCYVDMEELTYRISKVRRRLQNGVVPRTVPYFTKRPESET